MPVFNFRELFCLKIAKMGKYKLKNEEYGNSVPINKIVKSSALVFVGRYRGLVVWL